MITPQTNKTAFINARIFDGKVFHQNEALLVEADKIIGFSPISQIPSNYDIIDLKNGVLTSGFIDLQVNGGGNVLFNNSPHESGLKTITQAHLKFGTTSIMPTVISDTPNIVKQCVNAVQSAIKNNPSLLGIHIEGPFFNPKRRGVHKSVYIRKPNDEDIKFLRKLKDFPVMLTIAPEQFKMEQIQTLHQAGIKLLTGHSDANYNTIVEAVKNGLSGFTHLYNAMGTASAREPSVMGAALSLDDTTASIIVDGHHVHPKMIKLAYRCKPKGKLIFISDAMASIGGSPDFLLYGETIHEENGRIINREGTLAGSAIALIDAVRIAVQALQIPLEDALNMASLYPARYLNIDNKLGQLESGYIADLIHFDDNFKIRNVWKAGKPVDME